MDVMIDLETMGTLVPSSIVSVGALAFDRGKLVPENTTAGLQGHGFYQNVDLQSCIDLGLPIEGATVMWWLNRSDAARAALKTPPPKPVKDVMTALNSYLARHLTPRTGCVWSHGATFDIPIIAEIMRRLGLTPAWKFWNARDTRTVYDQAGVKLENANDRVGGHNAFYDCVAQTKLLHEAFRIIHTRGTSTLVVEETVLEEVNF